MAVEVHTITGETPIAAPKGKYDTLLIGALTATVVLLFAALGVVFFFQDDFDPISYSPDPRPIERILDDGTITVPVVEGYEGPAVMLGEQVPTTGTLCSTADGAIDVLGNVWWQRPGTSIRIPVVEDFPNNIEPGCRRLSFENDIPDEVEAFVRTSNEGSEWEITGSATPTRSGGVTATWRTEPFWVVPNE